MTGTNSLTGCSAVSSISIIVYPSPVVNITISPNTVCAGDTVHLSANGNVSSYLWSNGSNVPTFTVLAQSNTNYSVTGTGTNGCASTASLFLNVNPLPVITIACTPTRVCSGESVTLFSSGANLYSWQLGNVTLSGAFTVVRPLSTQIVTLTATNSIGCKTKDTLSVFVDVCTNESRNLTRSESSARIYPNPAQSVLYIDFVSDEVRQIEICDVNGKVLLSEEYFTTAFKLNIEAFNKGVYFIRIKENAKVETHCFIK